MNDDYQASPKSEHSTTILTARVPRENDDGSRAAIDRVINKLEKLADGNPPPGWLKWVRFLLLQGYLDCTQLDAKDGKGFFVKNFVGSLASKKAPIGILRRSLYFLDGRAKSKTLLGDHLALLWIREAIRDHGDPAASLRDHGRLIAARARAGDTEFFSRLARTLRETRARSGTSSWIVRLWIPLALWRGNAASDKTPIDVWPIFKQAVKTGVFAIDIKAASDKTAFVKAHGNARDTMRTRSLAEIA